eukprot:NODE_2321_length_1231_cov_41.082910_g2116_i0.p1 GENE.NODE_2321_length_1231_cov_41.082910_g2116_i0~~NODE_2321_length_1231_cov_41.082910_g2116_i0.p1  ORF type:complete len:378 (+),score=58.55 NODE_2321_length_1231_cov_41.082910_g2116_i0:74-1207(+)
MIRRSVVLSERPGAARPIAECNFSVIEGAGSSEEHDGSEIAVRTMYSDVSPYMRCRMNDNSGVEYAPAFALGSTIESAGIGIVERLPPGIQCLDLLGQPMQVGSFVASAPHHMAWPWSSIAYFKPSTASAALIALPTLSTAPLHVCGLPGLTALVGLRHHVQWDAFLRRPAGSAERPLTVAVSSAAGAVGIIVIQLLRLLIGELLCGTAGEGIRILGIASTEEKCSVLREKFNVDSAISYRSPAFSTALEGEMIDLYWDNCGGAVSETVALHLAPGAQIVLCGQIADYERDVPYPPPISENFQRLIQEKGVDRRRFLVLDYPEQLTSAIAELTAFHHAGKLDCPVTLQSGLEGIESAPRAFVELMQSRNIGKMLVKC